MNLLGSEPEALRKMFDNLDEENMGIGFAKGSMIKSLTHKVMDDLPKSLSGFRPELSFELPQFSGVMFAQDDNGEIFAAGPIGD